MAECFKKSNNFQLNWTFYVSIFILTPRFSRCQIFATCFNIDCNFPNFPRVENLRVNLMSAIFSKIFKPRKKASILRAVEEWINRHPEDWTQIKNKKCRQLIKRSLAVSFRNFLFRNFLFVNFFRNFFS